MNLSLLDINTNGNTQKCEKTYYRLRIHKYITFFMNFQMRIHTATHDDQRTKLASQYFCDQRLLVPRLCQDPGSQTSCKSHASTSCKHSCNLE